MGDSDYSFSLTTFSPSGKLVQIEYALNAVAAGSTSLGIKGLLPPRCAWVLKGRLRAGRLRTPSVRAWCRVLTRALAARLQQQMG
jgi:hypothetical protein